MTLVEKIENGDVLLIGKKELDSLLRMTRTDIKKGICSAKDAMYMLDMSPKTFYKHIEKKECLIELSQGKGKYNLKSVQREVDRLNNI